MPFDNLPTEIEFDLRALSYVREQIEAGKWCKHETESRPDRRCLMGWLLQVAPPARAVAITKIYLDPFVPVAGWGSVPYNDYRATREDMVNLIDRAIATYR